MFSIAIYSVYQWFIHEGNGHYASIQLLILLEEVVIILTLNLYKVAIQRDKIGSQERLSLNAGQKSCSICNWSFLSTFVKLPFAIQIFVLYF